MYNFTDEKLDILESDLEIILKILEEHKNLKLDINKREIAYHLPCFRQNKSNLYNNNIILHLKEYLYEQELRENIINKYDDKLSLYY